MSLGNFFTYNNAFPIAISVLFLGAGGVFAASNPATIYSEDERVISVDNTYIVNKDLSSHSPQTLITAVTEDADNYYVSYTIFTIDIKDYVWQDITRDETMKVPRSVLAGEYKDLGVYVTAQLAQIVDREKARLRESQSVENRRVTRKTVAVEYGGLIGKFFDATTKEFPGYVPVHEPDLPLPPPPNPEAFVAAAAEPGTEASPQSGQTSSGQSSGDGSGGADTTPPTIQILGENPIMLDVGAAYSELGVVITDNVISNYGLTMYVNGALVSSISIDTTEPGEFTIRYEAKDAAGNISNAERRVVVRDPSIPEETATSTPNGEGEEESTPPPPPPPPASSPVPEPEPTPTPAPEPTPAPTPAPETQQEE